MNKCSFRVYYEDTDAGGVVYYANYLKYAERARTELLRNIGINQSNLISSDSILFVVRNVSMDLIKPARLDDMLEVVTNIDHITAVTINMLQEIFCDGKKITDINVKIVCVDQNIKPKKIPHNIIEKFRKID